MKTLPNRIKKGQILNPNGANGNRHKGWQPYGLRCKYWLDKLSRQELIMLASDKKAFGNLSSYDAIIVTHLVETLAGDQKGPERERLLNRIEGQPKQTVDMIVENNGKVTFDGTWQILPVDPRPK